MHTCTYTFACMRAAPNPHMLTVWEWEEASEREYLDWDIVSHHASVLTGAAVFMAHALPQGRADAP